MIDPTRHSCCGCEACINICPVKCISPSINNHGFLEPTIDTNRCINCHLCEKTCPELNLASPSRPIKCYSAINKNVATVEGSSSGGIFSVLAENFLSDDGTVFGAAFTTDWKVAHSAVNTSKNLGALRKSKYVQSQLGLTFTNVQRILNSGGKVLFSGTPCQISALELFLRKDYGKNLIKLEVFCHGVPSPKVWHDYIEYFSTHNKISIIKDISFRYKKKDWSNYFISISSITTDNHPFEYYQYHYNNPYLWAFINSFTLRDACFSCPCRFGKTRADISIGDFWGIQKLLPTDYNPLGNSIIMLHTSNGVEYFESLRGLSKTPISYETVCQSAPGLNRHTPRPKLYDRFWSEYNKNGIPALISFYSENRFTFLQRYFKNPIKSLLKFLKNNISHNNP